MKTNRAGSAPKRPTEHSAGGSAGPNDLGSNAADLTPVVAALAKLNDGELCSLIEASRFLRSLRVILTDSGAFHPIKNNK